QANLDHIQVDSVPLEQTIYLSARAGASQGDGGTAGHMYAWSPSGSEIHADLGQAAGAQGLHRDTFDDWELADTHVEVPAAYEELLPGMEYSREHFSVTWNEENQRDWTKDAPAVLRQIVALDPREET